jgi:hypothetical protein
MLMEMSVGLQKGSAAASHNVDVHVTNQLLQFGDGNELLMTVPRTSRAEVRKKRASNPVIEPLT